MVRQNMKDNRENEVLQWNWEYIWGKVTLFIFSICKSDLKSEQWALVLTKLASVMSLF